MLFYCRSYTPSGLGCVGICAVTSPKLKWNRLVTNTMNKIAFPVFIFSSVPVIPSLPRNRRRH